MNTTSGAAIQRYKIGYHADEWGQRSSTPSGIPDASGSWVRYEEHIAALAAGQATAGQAVVQDDLITLRKPTTSAELLWLLKLAQLVISDVDKTLEETFSPSQPAAQQGVAYAALPDEREAFESWLRSVWTAGYGCPKCDSGKYVHGEAQRFWECWQARASHGQAPAGAAVEMHEAKCPALIGDACSCERSDPAVDKAAQAQAAKQQEQLI